MKLEEICLGIEIKCLLKEFVDQITGEESYELVKRLTHSDILVSLEDALDRFEKQDDKDIWMIPSRHLYR